MLRKISTWLETDAPKRRVAIRCCDYSGCEQEGLYKAPKEPTPYSIPQQQWYWFCKQHVRSYNDQWNYYIGMSEQQAYDSYKNDMMWNRQSWPRGDQPLHYTNFQDPFGVVPDASPSPPQLSLEDQESLKILRLKFPFSQEQLQLAYRHQVKKNHPDINKSKDSEEKIRKINNAYNILKKWIM